MRYLGLDLGSKTLGIAISDKTGVIATSYKTIRHNEEYLKLIDEVKKIVDELEIDAIVLGFPKNMNNTIGPKGQLSLEFKYKLEQALKIPIYLEDERLTTVSATNLLISGNVSRKKRKKVVDSVAAFTFESEESHKNYIVYTDNKKDESGNIEVYASIYYPDDPQSKLEAIKTDKEWKVIETILDTLQEEVNKKKNNETNEQ